MPQWSYQIIESVYVQNIICPIIHWMIITGGAEEIGGMSVWLLKQPELPVGICGMFVIIINVIIDRLGSRIDRDRYKTGINMLQAFYDRIHYHSNCWHEHYCSYCDHHDKHHYKHHKKHKHHKHHKHHKWHDGYDDDDWDDDDD